MSGKVAWLPLESNPDVITKFMHNIGVNENVQCVDVLGFDEELIMSPCYALLLCFPDYKKVDKIMSPIYAKLSEEGVKIPENVFFMKQKISNACGTFALLHALVNNRDNIDLGKGALHSWIEKALQLGDDERSELLFNDKALAEAHVGCALAGDTNVPPSDEKVEHHFICYVNVGGTLYEIDSRAPFPRACGATTEKSLMKDAGSVCQKLMAEMENISFSALAIVPA